jgi:hypothetical protein
MKKMVPVAVAAILCMGTAVYAQDWIVEKLRADLRAERAALVEEEMQFTEEEAAVFWPVFKKYESELRRINSERLTLVAKYAENYADMSESVADAIVRKSLELDIKEAYVRKEYFREFKHVLTPTRAAKFLQLDGLLNLLVRAQVASSLPFIE